MVDEYDVVGGQAPRREVYAARRETAEGLGIDEPLAPVPLFRFLHEAQVAPGRRQQPRQDRSL